MNRCDVSMSQGASGRSVCMCDKLVCTRGLLVFESFTCVSFFHVCVVAKLFSFGVISRCHMLDVVLLGACSSVSSASGFVSHFVWLDVRSSVTWAYFMLVVLLCYQEFGHLARRALLQRARDCSGLVVGHPRAIQAGLFCLPEDGLAPERTCKGSLRM